MFNTTSRNGLVMISALGNGLDLWLRPLDQKLTAPDARCEICCSTIHCCQGQSTAVVLSSAQKKYAHHGPAVRGARKCNRNQNGLVHCCWRDFELCSGK